MTFIANTTNEHGTPCSDFIRETCPRPITVTPEVPEDRRTQWANRLATECASYNIGRDADPHFILRQVETVETE